MASTGTNFGELDVTETTSVVGGIKADTLIWDATENASDIFASLDGGAGNDSLTLRLTNEQFTSLMNEITADQPGAKLKADGTLIGDGSTFSGNNFDHLNALNLDVKNWENVHIQHLSGQELLQNWNFESDVIPTGSDYVSHVPTGWTNEGAVTPEVVKAPYGAQTGFAAGEHQWLDSAASPGGIDIGQQMELATGQQAKLSVSVSAQDLHLPSGTFTIDPNATLEFKFNNVDVLTIKASDFTDFNTFHTFSADVTGGAGTDHLEIISHGQDGAFVGFAVDHVSLQQWIV